MGNHPHRAKRPFLDEVGEGLLAIQEAFRKTKADLVIAEIGVLKAEVARDELAASVRIALDEIERGQDLDAATTLQSALSKLEAR